MKKRAPLISSTLSLLLTSTAFAQAAPQLTLFGLTFGATLSLPECVMEKPLYSSSPAHYELIARKTCLQYGADRTPLAIQYEFSEKPAIVSGHSLKVHVENGGLAYLSFTTHGQLDQETVFKTLSDKFGRPTYAATPTKQNRMGAQFQSIEATWNLTNLNVAFVGISGRVDLGFVSIGTPSAVEAVKQREAAIFKDPRPL